jgi:uncharacterized membrane-anchored protein
MTHRFVGFAVAFAVMAVGFTQPARAYIPGWPEETPTKTVDPAATAAEAEKKAAEARRASVQHEINAAWAQTQDVAVHGPDVATIADGITMHLPPGFIYVPQPYADRILKVSMIPTMPDTVGFIVNTGQGWTTLVGLSAEGHVAAPAEPIDANVALAAVARQSRESDRELIAQGKPATIVTGWFQSPSYDPSAHSLTWSLHARWADEVETGESLARYQALVLGRTRQIHLTSLVPQNFVATQGPVLKSLIEAVRFASGQQYADFDANHDKIAGVTLASFYGASTSAVEEPTGSPLTSILFAVAIGLAGVGSLIAYRRHQRPEPAEAEA